MNSLQIAIDYFGSQAELARAIDVNPMAVTQWKKRGIPPVRAKQIERITNGKVKAAQILPEIFN